SAPGLDRYAGCVTRDAAEARPPPGNGHRYHRRRTRVAPRNPSAGAGPPDSRGCAARLADTRQVHAVGRLAAQAAAEGAWRRGPHWAGPTLVPWQASSQAPSITLRLLRRG